MKHFHDLVFPSQEQNTKSALLEPENSSELVDADNLKYDNRFEVIVKGMHTSYKEGQIAKIFGYFGQVDKVKIERNPDGTSKGSCFIAFADYESVMRALQMNKTVFNNQKILIEKTKDKSTRTKEKNQKLGGLTIGAQQKQSNKFNSYPQYLYSDQM